MNTVVQSVRSVGSIRGYTYYAYGVYELKPTLDGRLTYRLVQSGRWFRSDVRGRHAFDGIREVRGVRHGTMAPVVD